MTISQKYKFILIKTSKTDGTSIEIFLSKLCDEKDIVTPIYPSTEGHHPRNYKGFFDPIPEFFGKYRRRRDVGKDAALCNEYYNHIPAVLVKQRLSAKCWNDYYKFAVERDP